MPTNLHHINGDRFDNRIDNLKILCPNCHALTPNYGSKNSANHILSKYTYDEFKELAEKHSVKELSVITQLGRGSVKAILKHYGLKTHSCSFGSVVEARRKFNPTKEDLEKAVWSLPTTKVARFYGVSDTAVAKRCRLFGIKKPPRGYWSSSLQHGGRSSIG